MKRILCILLTLVMMLAFIGCKKDAVTIYIPEKVTSYDHDGKQRDSWNVVFEDGWEKKEQFTVQHIGPAPNSSTTIFTYGERFTSLEHDLTGVSTETNYNEKGLVIRQVTTYKLTEYTKISKSESTATYDPQGRVLTQSTKTFFSDGTVQEKDITYVYIDTADGSKGSVTENGVVTEEVTYDQDFRRIGLVTYDNGEEVHRIEWVYDAHGNLIRSKGYIKGEQITHTETTYKTVEVSKEFADRLPQFKQEN